MQLLPRFLRLCVVFALFFTLASANYTRAATFVVPPGDVDELIRAINAANDEVANPGEDTIFLQGGVYTLELVNNSAYTDNGLPVISSHIRIEGNGSTIERLLTAPSFRLFYMGTGGSLYLDNLIIKNGAADGSGGAIFNNSGEPLEIRNSIFINNTVVGSGGAINSPNLTVSNTAFLNNYTTGIFGRLAWGGAIISGGNMQISNSTFSGNSGERGGAVFFCNGTALISNTTFDNNVGNGGAISNCGSMTITDTMFTLNADSAIEHYGGEMIISRSILSRNSGQGIKISNSANTVIEDMTEIIYNNAGAGAGVYHAGTGSLEISDTTIAYNIATGPGGGIYSADLTITDSLVLNNTAYVGGGMLDGGNTVNISNSIFSGNTATSGIGGAIYVFELLDNLQTSHISYNCFTNNGDQSISNPSGDELDLTYNWWGSSDGPSGAGLMGHGDSISENVQYSPFLTSPPAGCDTIWQPENMPPVANEDNVVTAEDTAVTFNVLSNDTDVDNNLNAASATATSNPLNGVLTANGSGNFSYTPNPNFSGTDNFTYQVCDSLNACDSATVSIQVNPVNDPPILTVNCSTVNVDEGNTALCSGSVSDVDGGSLSLMASAGVIQPTVINGNGNWNWTFDAQDGPTNSQMISVSVSDSQSISSGTFNLVVNNIAPQISNLTGSTLDPVTVNSQFCLTGTFDDPSLVDVYSAQWNWGDNQISTQAIGAGTGPFTVANCRVYTVPGVYTVALNITDDDNGSDSEQYQYVVVYDPTGGFVTGSGIIQSPAGAFVANPALTGNAHFGFVSKYQNGANVPTGNTRFRFQVADLDFRSVAYEWLVVAGARAQFKGTGTINGQGNYGFMLTAIDGQINGGGGVDRFRIKIWDITTGSIVYDNQHGSADNGPVNTVITAGNITVHK